jgi:hypothetical protein
MLPHIKNGRSDASYQRSTVPLKQLLVWANRQLARTDEEATLEFKIATCNMIEDALYYCRKYKGFGFIDNDDSKVGTLGYYSRVYFG